MRTVMAIMIDDRKDEAIQVQKILTAWGCIIKVRLGLHDEVLDNCSNYGLLMLELVGTPEQHEEMCRKLNLLNGVHAKYMNLSFEEKDM